LFFDVVRDFRVEISKEIHSILHDIRILGSEHEVPDREYTVKVLEGDEGLVFVFFLRTLNIFNLN
jgi:hypothetical protein